MESEGLMGMSDWMEGSKYNIGTNKRKDEREIMDERKKSTGPLSLPFNTAMH